MKILFIACYSPLINNSASIETLQYLNNLVNEGNDIHLLTVDFPKNSIYYDEYILSMLNPRVKIHKVSGGKIFEKIMPKKGNNGVNSKNNSSKSALKELLKKGKKIIAIPDMYLNWARKASKVGLELMDKERFDVIFSMHEPPSSHICAMYIKKENKGVPWITYWSDPWLKDSTRENMGHIRRKIEGGFEKYIINLADRHIFVTKSNRDDYLNSYNIPKEKTFILTRGYDEKAYEKIKSTVPAEKINKDKINFIYAGEIFSKLRNTNPFVEALKILEKRDPESFKKLNVLFFGNIDNEGMKKNLVDVAVVDVSPRIPYDKAISYMLNGDVLMIFGNKNSRQIPAKIYDYFGADGIIFVILGDENDPILDVVRDKEKCIVVNNNPEEIVGGIYKIFNHLDNEDKFHPLKEYKWENISGKLNDILKG